MLPTSSTTPAAAALVSSEALPAMTAAQRSSQHVESKDSATESESDAEEKGYLSENDLEMTVEQSHTDLEMTGEPSRQCVFSTRCMSWATRSRCLTSMG